jgi:hypothetical protein
MLSAQLALLPKERVSAFAFQAGMAIETDYTDRSFALDRLDDSGSPFMPKATAQLDGRNAVCYQVAGHLFGLGIILRGNHGQLYGGCDHLTTMNCRIHIRRNKDESGFQRHVRFLRLSEIG